MDRRWLRSLSVWRIALSLTFGFCVVASAQVATPRTHPAGNHSTRIEGLSGRPFAVRVSPTGLVYATQQDDDLVASFALAGNGTLGPSIGVGRDPGDVVFSRDGRTAFVSAFHGGTIHVIDVRRGRETATIRIGTNAYRLALSPNARTLFVSSTDGRVYSVSTSRKRVTRSVALEGAIQGLALSASGRFLVATSTNGAIWKLNAGTLKVIKSGVPRGNLQDVAYSQDEREIYVANERGWVDVLDGTTLERLSRITLDGMAPFGLAVTPDGAQLYVTSPASGQLAIIDRETRSLLRGIHVAGNPRRVTFDASGSTALIANEGNWVDVVR